jgi:hypothetical protein
VLECLPKFTSKEEDGNGKIGQVQKANNKKGRREERGKNGNGCGEKRLQNSQRCCDFVVVFSRS